MTLTPEVLIVLLASAAQVGALLRFMAKWERRMTAIETVVMIIAAKAGIPFNGNGAKAQEGGT